MLCLRLSALVSSHSPEAYMVWKLPINNRCEFACVIMSPGDTLVTCPGCNRPLAPIRAAIDLSLCEPGHDEQAWKMDGGMRIPITVSRACVCLCLCVFVRALMLHMRMFPLSKSRQGLSTSFEP